MYLTYSFVIHDYMIAEYHTVYIYIHITHTYCIYIYIHMRVVHGKSDNYDLPTLFSEHEESGNKG